MNPHEVTHSIVGETYPDYLTRVLKPRQDLGITALDLFAGCGGLALGFEAVGFSTIGFEMDGDAAKTYRQNLAGDCHEIFLTPATELPEAQVVIGGPPCQPFSVGGKQAGSRDKRDGFPAFIAAIEQVRPEALVFENVRGLMYRNKTYLHEVVGKLRELGYEVDVQLANAKHYGVPQNRERVIVVGHQGGFRFPPAVKRERTAGEAIGDTAHLELDRSKFLTSSMDAYVLKYEIASKCANPRDLDLSRPARTLTCRNLAGATGDMQRVRLADGRRRRLTVREAARLQSFPDWFEFVGSEQSCFNQCGNAVAPLFAYHIARQLAAYMTGTTLEGDWDGKLFA